MQFSFTPQAAKKLQEILAEAGGDLALRIEIHRVLGSSEWRITLEPQSPTALLVDGLPIHASPAALKHLEGLLIDWLMTPDGPGLGVYDKNLLDRDLQRGL